MPIVGALTGVRSLRSAAAIPVVTGGTLTSDATYYYRTFTSAGDLVVSGASLNVEYLVIGAGGGGGRA